MKLIPKPKTSQKVESIKEIQSENSDPTRDLAREKLAERKLADLRKTEPAVRKVIRKAAVLADLLTEEDLEQDVRVIREACDAEHLTFNPLTKTFERWPDHKTRLAAVTLRRAYAEGKPVERQVTITSTFESADDLLKRIRTSPEAMRVLQTLGAGVEVAGEIIDIAAVQKSGGENPDVASIGGE